MFMERKNYNLKTLNYLFLKMGIKTNLFAISNIYEKYWSDKSLEGILNELSINYNLTTELKTTPCILCGNNYPLVALEVYDDKIRVWDPVKKRKEFIEKKETFTYINIKYLNNNQLNILSIIHYIKEKYKFLFKNIILTMLFIMLSGLKVVLLTVIGYLCYMNLDYYFMFVDFTNMLHNMVICLLLFLGIVIDVNISNILINKITKDNKKDFILGENNFFKLIDYFFVGLLLSIVVYYSNKNIGFIIAIHTLGVIFLNKNIVGYNKSLIKNINYLYLGLNLILFITLIISLIFNDLVGYSYLVIPIIGYLYIFIYGFSIQKYYKQINDYVYHLKVEIWEKISNTTLVSKITLSKPENLYLIGDTHIVIEKNKVNLLFDKNDEKIDQLIECLKDNSITHFKMYLGKENIKDYSINSLKDKIFIINNHFQKKYFDYGSVYKNDFEEIDEILDLENIYSKDVFTDTDLLIINVCQSILNNPFYLIFDNVLSRFNDEIINKILKACKIFNITVVILEHKNLDNKYIENTIDWNEGIE